MNWTQIVAGAATILLGLMLCVEAYDAVATTPDPESPPVPPSIEAIREVSELTVLEVEATEVVTASVEGRVGGTTVVALVRGIVTIGVDLDDARFVEIDQERRHLVLALPPPTVHRVAIDPATIRVLHTQRGGLWQIAVGPAHEQQGLAMALVIGQQRLQDAASRSDLMTQAKRHAVAVLQEFAVEVDWALEVQWEE